MKTRILLKAAFLCLLVTGFSKAFAGKPNIVISGNITASTTWDSANTYTIKDYVYVTTPVGQPKTVLTIKPGTVIYGAAAPHLGALIICAGAQIIADGTLGHPIVFTSSKPAGARARGDWGGLILLGYAPHNLGGAYIEGIVPNDFTKFGPLAAARDGVAVNANDNSGILRYVRVEFAGYALSPNNEINGVTCGAVGNGTIIDYLQISYANDDSIEWFGGTVDGKHIIAFRGIDDDFDSDNGYSGRNQFCLGLRDPNVADQSQSAGYESDNNADGTLDLPQTRAVYANMTVSSGGDSTNNALFKGSAHIRRNAAISIINSINMGYPQGLQIDGSLSARAVVKDTLVFNSIIAMKQPSAGVQRFITTPSVAGNSSNSALNNLAVFATAGSLADSVYKLLTNGANNSFVYGNAAVKLTDPYNLNSPNYLPATGSPALGTAVWNQHVILNDSIEHSGALVNAFFDTTVTYRGAFGDFDWTQGWANFNPTAGDAPTVDPNAICTKKGTTPTLSKATFVNDVCKTGRVTFIGVGGKAAAGEQYKYTFGKVNAIGDTTILITDTTAASNSTNMTVTELPVGVYVAKVKLGACATKFAKVATIIKYVPAISSYTSGTDSINVKVTLGKIYTAMSGYAFQIRYADSANAAAGKWSIWGGSNTSNTYYDGKGKDGAFGPLWRDIDTTKLPTVSNQGTGTGKDYLGNTLTNLGTMTPASESYIRFNPNFLRADTSKAPYHGGTAIKVPIVPNTKYAFQLVGRCFTALGKVVYGDIISSPWKDSTSPAGKAVKMFATKAPKVKKPVAHPAVAATSTTNAIAESINQALVYPNPSKGIVNINLAGFNGKVGIQVINVKGQVVYSSTETSLKASSKTIDLSRVAAGNYFVVITNGASKISKQIVIVK